MIDRPIGQPFSVFVTCFSSLLAARYLFRSFSSSWSLSLYSLQSFPPRSGQWTRLGSTMMTESRLAMGLNRHPATVASQNVTPKRRRPTAAALREASCPTNTPKQATSLRQWTPTLLRRIQSTSLCRLHRIATMGGHNRLSTRTARRALPTVTIT